MKGFKARTCAVDSVGRVHRRLVAVLLSAIFLATCSLAQQGPTLPADPLSEPCFAQAPPGQVPAATLEEGLRLVEADCTRGSVGSLQLGIYRLEWQDAEGVWQRGEQVALLRSTVDDLWWYRLGAGGPVAWSTLAQAGDPHILSELIPVLLPDSEVPSSSGGDPCGGASECQSWSSWIFDQRVGDNGPGLRRLDRVLHRRALGWQGVAQWLARALDGVPESPQAANGSDYPTAVRPRLLAGLPRSSWLTWTLTSRTAGRSELLERHWNLPSPSSLFPGLDLPAWPASSSVIPPRPVSPSAPAPAAGGSGLAAPAASPTRGSTSSPSESFCPGMVHVPRARAEGYGFEWSWHPLALAETDLATGGATSTTSAGCLPVPPATEFALELRNDRVHIQSRAAFDESPILAWNPVTIRVPQGGPYVFVQPGGDYREKLVAANIFSWLNHGIDRFTDLDPSLGRLVANLEISQWRHLETCAGHWPYPGKIYLPLACPFAESFVPKGMCPDVVLHELSHEVIGRAVKQASHQGTVDGDLFEALADHFAMGFRGGSGRPSFFRFGLNCQNDHRIFDLDRFGSGLGRYNLQVVLGSLRQHDLNAEQGKVFDKLLTLAVRLAPNDIESFVRQLVDLAVKEKSVDIADQVCQALVDHAGHCDDLCKGRSLCTGFTKTRRVGDRLTVEGRFLGSVDRAPEPACTTYALRVEDLDSGQQIDCRSGEAAHLEESFDLAPGTGPLALRLQACAHPAPDPCSATDEVHANGAHFETAARIDGWPSAQLQPGRQMATQLAFEAPALADFGDGPPLLGVTAAGDFGVVSATGLRQFEVVEEGADDGKLYRLSTDVTTSGGGQVQGWSVDGRQLSTHLEPAPGQADGWRWRWVSGDQRPGEVERDAVLRGDGPTLVATDPRVELLAWDASRLTVGDWSRPTPEIRSLPWPEPIDPTTLQVLWTPGGPVLSAEQRFPRQQRVLQIDTSLPEPTLVDVETTWLVRPIELPGLRVTRWRDGRALRNWTFRIDQSLCRAPPFLAASMIGSDSASSVECDGDRCRLAVLTCDGHLARLDLSSELPVWSRPTVGDTAVPLNLHGVVPSIDGLHPLQSGTFTGNTEQWLAGPLRSRDETGRWVDRLWILDEDLQIVPLTVPISTLGPLRASPVVTRVEGDDPPETRPQILLLTDDGVEVWRALTP